MDFEVSGGGRIIRTWTVYSLKSFSALKFYDQYINSYLGLRMWVKYVSAFPKINSGNLHLLDENTTELCIIQKYGFPGMESEMS